jgi:hypothetical protein
MVLILPGHPMRTAFRWIFRLFLLALLAVTLLIAHTLLFKPLKPDWFYERVFVEYGMDDPQMLSSMRMLPGWMDWYSDDLTDQSLAQERKMQDKLKKDLATLQKYDRKGMNEADALNYDMLRYFLAIQAEGEKYAHHNYPLNQLFGIQNEFPTFMATQHPVESEADAENYLARLGKTRGDGRSGDGRPAGARTGEDPSAHVCGRESAEGNACVHRRRSETEHPVQLVG